MDPTDTTSDPCSTDAQGATIGHPAHAYVHTQYGIYIGKYYGVGQDGSPTYMYEYNDPHAGKQMAIVAVPNPTAAPAPQSQQMAVPLSQPGYIAGAVVTQPPTQQPYYPPQPQYQQPQQPYYPPLYRPPVAQPVQYVQSPIPQAQMVQQPVMGTPQTVSPQMAQSIAGQVPIASGACAYTKDELNSAVYQAVSHAMNVQRQMESLSLSGASSAPQTQVPYQPIPLQPQAPYVSPQRFAAPPYAPTGVLQPRPTAPGGSAPGPAPGLSTGPATGPAPGPSSGPAPGPSGGSPSGAQGAAGGTGATRREPKCRTILNEYLKTNRENELKFPNPYCCGTCRQKLAAQGIAPKSAQNPPADGKRIRACYMCGYRDLQDIRDQRNKMWPNWNGQGLPPWPVELEDLKADVREWGVKTF